MAISRIKIEQNQEYIELGNLLKVLGYISTGGAAKSFLLDNDVYVDGEKETRRGRKIYRGLSLRVNKDDIVVE